MPYHNETNGKQDAMSEQGADLLENPLKAGGALILVLAVAGVVGAFVVLALAYLLRGLVLRLPRKRADPTLRERKGLWATIDVSRLDVGPDEERDPSVLLI